MKLTYLSIFTSMALLAVSCSSETTEEVVKTENEITSDANISFENAEGKAQDNPNATQFSVKGELAEGADQKIFLYHFAGQFPTVIDSAIISNKGAYNLSGKGEGYQFYAVGSSPQKFKLLLLNSTENVTVSGDYNLLQEATIEGSVDSKILEEYTLKQKDFYIAMQDIQAKLKALPQDPNNKQRIALTQQSETLTRTYSAFVLAFIDKNIASPAILSAANDLFDPATQMTYLKKIEATLEKTMKDSPFHTSLKGSMAQVELQQQQLQASQGGQVQIGQVAPELNFPSPSGKNIALSSLKGKVVLIDFWASWCKPCRIENPNVVRLYNQYKDKGFTIYSVSLDKDKPRWESAIAQDALAWPNHVSDLKGWQSAASALYGVNGIPYTVLLDKDGKVIATNLRGIQLEQKLKEILG